MKVSFSLSSKSSSSKPKLTANPSQTNNNVNVPKPKFLTVFQSSSNPKHKPNLTINPFQTDEETTTINQHVAKPKNTIPRVEKTFWHPIKKMRNLDEDPNLNFELETPDTHSTNLDSSMGYGLTLRSKTNNEEGSSLPVETILLQKFKQDITKLPDVRMEDHEEMPVEGFGAALLGAYGWKEGQEIERRGKENVKVVEYVKKSGRGGLGFHPDAKSLVNKKMRKVDVGKIVRIVGGRHVGLEGKVLKKSDDLGVVILNLVKSDEEVEVGVHEIAKLGSVEEEKCLKKLKDGRSRHSEEEEEKGLEGCWVKSNIRVRVICKMLKKGKLYLKKGKVLDVVGDRMCDVCMDDSKEIIQGVSQEILETVLPRRGGRVLVLFGKHEGVYGELVEKNVEKKTGVVRDVDSHALVDVCFEEVVEYIGDPSSLGY